VPPSSLAVPKEKKNKRSPSLLSHVRTYNVVLNRKVKIREYVVKQS